jgi:fructose transport system permease protein
LTSDPVKTGKAAADFEAGLEKADTSVASFEKDDVGVIDRIRGFLHANPTAIPALVLFFSVIVFGLVAGDRFFSPRNLSTVMQQVTVIGIVAVAQTIIILTAGIDLSVGAIIVLCSFVMGKLAVNAGVPEPLAIAAAMGAGGVMGYLNGLLVTRLQLPPFIVTLGTLNIFQALKLWYSGSESIRANDIEEKAPLLIFFGKTFEVLGAPIMYGSIALILLAALVWYLLTWTAWGRHVHAIGDDPDAARLAGIQTNRTLNSVYIAAGVICGFGAWVLIGRVGSISPIAIETANLDSITAVVIGGTSLFGGRGSIPGSILGALIVGVFRNGLVIAGQDKLWQDFTVGVLIIVAVAIDQWMRRATK